MRKRVRAIIIESNNIILIKRTRPSREEYWVFPGGLVEEGENAKEALIRECREELGIKIKVGELLIKEELDIYEEKFWEYFYLCEKTGGKLGTGNGPEYSEYKEKGWGTHEPVLVPKDEIKNLNLLPEEVKNLVLKII